MVWRDRMREGAAGIIGILVAVLVVYVLLTGAGVVLAMTGVVFPGRGVLGGLILLAMAAGFISGVWTCRRGHFLQDVFRPTREVVAAAAALGFIFVVGASLVWDGSTFVAGAVQRLSPAVLVWGTFHFMAAFYPFTALNRYLTRHVRALPRPRFALLVVLALLLNPASVAIGTSYVGAMTAVVEAEPCGVEIVSVEPGSPADRAGLGPPERIIRIGNASVHTAWDAVTQMNRTAPGSTVVVRTNVSTYGVNLEEGSTHLGLRIVTRYCPAP